MIQKIAVINGIIWQAKAVNIIQYLQAEDFSGHRGDVSRANRSGFGQVAINKSTDDCKLTNSLPTCNKACCQQT